MSQVPKAEQTAENEKGSRDIPAMKRVLWSTILICIGIFAVATVISLSRDSGSGFHMSGEGFAIADENGEEVFTAFTEILSAELTEKPDYGTGSVENGMRVRGWQSETYGSYLAYCDRDIWPAIVIRTADRTILINYESSGTTAQLCEEIRHMAGLTEEGQDS